MYVHNKREKNVSDILIGTLSVNNNGVSSIHEDSAVISDWKILLDKKITGTIPR